jgi:septal ring factor EnvC (AmiA/AmiB activator)
MMSLKRTAHARATAAVAVCAGVFGIAAALPGPSGAEPSLGQLHASLAQAQARAQELSGNVSHLSTLISSLATQVVYVRAREAAVQAQLAGDRAQLARTTAELARERHKLAALIQRLHRAQSILASQLVYNYEHSSPDLVSVVLSANGFSQLINELNDLRRAEQEQKTEITITARARDQVHATTVRLGRLQASYRRMTVAATARARALQGMNALLSSRQAALQQARAAQAAALSIAQSRGQALQSEIARVQAEQAAAQRAAEATPAAPTFAGSSSTPSGSAPAPSGGWVIPAAIVMCESGGQNLPPNSAGASGYYQIIPSTWREYGGTGPAAYLASKAEQDAVAQRIWDSVGPSAWDCARILGIH